VADGGATYTVNIELATRQFSQDLRDLRTKIKNELGKTIKVATTPDQKAEAKEKARKLREKRQEDQAAKKRFYNADRIKAFQVRQGEAVSANLKLEKYGLNVQQRKIQLGKVQEAAELGKIQWSEAKLKKLNKEIDAEFKILDLINKQSEAEKKLAAETKKKAEAEKKAQDRAKEVVATRKREDKAKKAEATALRQRKGPHGSVMHGPVDIYGNPIYQGGTSRGPSIPKTGAALPIDLGRKGTGTFATKHTQLLRRREVLETLLKTFDGVKTDEVRKFKQGIEGLLSQYKKVSELQGKMKPKGKQYTATGGWGEWKGDKLVTKDRIGNAGEIARELEQLDNLTKLEESRAKRIKATNESELKAAKRRSAFLNKEHSARKLIERLKKKGVKTTELELKLEKAITAQDKDQLDTAAREIDMINAKSTRAGKGGKKGGGIGGGTTSTKAGGGGNFGRIASAAGISGGFPLLFGQSPGVAAFSALGGGIGEAVSPGGGFAGGIVASALATKFAETMQFRKEIDKVNKSITATGGTSLFTARGIEKLGRTLSMTKEEALNAAKSFAAFDASVRTSLLIAFGDEGTFNMVKGLKTNADLLKNIQAAEGKIGREKADQLINLMKTEGSLKVQKKLQDAILESQKKSVTGSKDQVNAFDAFMGMGRTLGNKYMNLFGQGPGEGNATVTGEDIRDIRMEKLLGDSQQDAVKKLGEELDRAFKLELITNIATVRDEIEQLQSPLFLLTKTAETVGNAFSESFKGIVKGSMTAKEALANLFQRTADMFLDMAAKMIAKQIQMKILGIGLNFLGGIGTTPSGSALKSGSFGTGVGKVTDTAASIGRHAVGGSSVQPNFTPRAFGGPVSGGSPYVVGEKGPELFVPGSSGNIVPNHAMGGANVVVNVDASGSSVEGDAGQAEQLGSMLAAAVQAEIANQQRPGGLLARR
jgi:hypothetical protein